MLTLALTFKTVFRQEKHRRLAQLLDEMGQAAAAVLLAVFAAISFLSLFSLFSNHTVPWSQLLHLVDELAFVVALLLSMYTFLGLGKYLAWRLRVKTWKLITGHFGRAGQMPPSADASPIQLLTWQIKQTQQQIAAFRRQLRQGLANHPPGLWSGSKAPLPLFQQAALRLGP